MYSRFGQRYLYILLPVVALSIAMIVQVPLWAYQGSNLSRHDFLTSFISRLYTWAPYIGDGSLKKTEIDQLQVMSFNDIVYIVVGLIIIAGVFKHDLEGPGIYRIVREHTRLIWFLRKSFQLLVMSFIYAFTYMIFVGSLVIIKENYAWSNLATAFIYCLHATLLLWLFALIINVAGCYLGGAIGFGVGLFVFGALFLIDMQISLSGDILNYQVVKFNLLYNPLSNIGDGSVEKNLHAFYLIRSSIYCIICGGIGAFMISRKDLSLRHSEA